MRLSQITGGKSRVVTLTGSGTFTVPDNVYKLEVTLQGAGASGGAYINLSNPYCSGGGAGALIFRYPLSVTPGQEIAYSCGAGGASVTVTTTTPSNGNDGGDTTFGSLTAAGGEGGLTGLGSVAGSGPSISGDPIIPGFSFPKNSSDSIANLGVTTRIGYNTGYLHGTVSYTPTAACGGGGAPSSFGNGGNGASSVTFDATIVANNADGYGAGGGGAGIDNNSGSATSGAGTDGLIIVEFTGNEYA